MSKRPMRTAPASDAQLDLFAPVITDFGPRDAREVMELPFLSLSKQKRSKPIEFTSEKGARIRVMAPAEIGIANIYDWDIIIFLVSVVRDALNKNQPVSPLIRWTPGDFLKATRRPNTRQYQDAIARSIRRLNATVIETNIRSEDQKGKLKDEIGFHWLDSYQVRMRTINAKEGPKEIVEFYETRLCSWLYQAAIDSQLVLAFDPDYFLLDGGYERWLYRLIRKSAGHGEWTWSLRTLHARSGEGEEYKKFAYRIREIVRRSADEHVCPGYRLSLVTGSGAAGKGELALHAKAIDTKGIRAPMRPGEDTHRVRAGAFALDFETEEEARKLCAMYELDYNTILEAWKQSNMKKARAGKTGAEAGVSGHLKDRGRAFIGYIKACGKPQKRERSTTYEQEPEDV